MALSEDEVSIFSEKIFRQFLDAFGTEEISNIHLFLSITRLKEIKTEPFIRHFSKAGARIFVPKIIETRIASIEIDETTEFEINKWGIPEPKSNNFIEGHDFDAVFVPMLYCDSLGNRIGYGKGFYDRLFSEINPQTLKIGLNYFCPKETIDDVYFGDVAVDFLVTPAAVLSFKGGVPTKFSK